MWASEVCTEAAFREVVLCRREEGERVDGDGEGVDEEEDEDATTGKYVNNEAMVRTDEAAAMVKLSSCVHSTMYPTI